MTEFKEALRSIWIPCCTTRKPRTGRFWKRALRRRVDSQSSLQRARRRPNHGINTIPFFVYYSMFGLQRVGDLVWAAGDQRTKGFLCGGTAGRTTLGERDCSIRTDTANYLAYSVPNLLAYDPAFAYEIAIIVQDGIRRMYVEQEDIFYYITVMNETWAQPNMPEGVREGI